MTPIPVNFHKVTSLYDFYLITTILSKISCAFKCLQLRQFNKFLETILFGEIIQVMLNARIRQA